MPGTITLTDDQRTAQPLLEAFGIIIAPEEVSHASYVQLSWALAVGRALHGDQPLALRCYGDGGDADAALALVDLIQADGNVDGIALGEVSSANATLWVACARRYITPHAMIAIHGVSHGEWRPRWDAEMYRRKVAEFDWYNERLAQLLAAVSTRTARWWLKRLSERGDVLIRFDYDAVVDDLEMARPLKERSHAV
jgi:ATP-dependent protease ClpP protease subunit